MDAPNKTRVRFSVDDDDQANKITALLEALGYEAVREIDHGSVQTRLRWALTRLCAKASLTERERDILDRVLQGRVNGEIGDELGISKATVKWHMHNIFTKTGAGTREALLREALQLGGGSARASEPVAIEAQDSEPGSAAPAESDGESDGESEGE